MSNLKVREIVLAALFIALITAGTFIRIPLGGDFYTLQFLFTLLAGLVLGEKIGTLAVGVYVLMGLIGIPVFASGGGPSYISQPTFGYLIGFIVQAWICGKLSRKIADVNFKNLLMINLAGMLAVYVIGMAWFYVVSNFIINAPIAFWTMIFYSFVLQVVPDGILCAAAAISAVRCHKSNLWL